MQIGNQFPVVNVEAKCSWLKIWFNGFPCHESGWRGWQRHLWAPRATTRRVMFITAHFRLIDTNILVGNFRVEGHGQGRNIISAEKRNGKLNWEDGGKICFSIVYARWVSKWLHSPRKRWGAQKIALEPLGRPTVTRLNEPWDWHWNRSGGPL